MRRLPTQRLVCEARTVISVLLGLHYRVLFRDEKGVLRPLCCLSHEAYNKWRPG